MFDRVAIRASDLEASRAFYGPLLPLLGTPEAADPTELVIVAASAEEPVTRGLHAGLLAASPAHVDAFWQAGVDAGFTSDGEPGPRPEYADDYYGAFLLDPDGNSIEAALHGNQRAGGLVDHLWLRVLNVPMTRRFYEATAGQAGARSGPHDGEPGYALVVSEPTLARFRGPAGGSLTLVEGPEPSAGLDITIGGARFLDDDGRSLKLRAQPR